MADPKLKFKPFVSTTNYTYSNGGNDNFTSIGGSASSGNFNLSLSVGNYFSASPDGARKNTPTFEAKAKYKINEHLNAQFRFREKGGTEQYRIVFGGNCGHMYWANHLTECEGIWKDGIWVGVSGKIGNHLNWFAEAQQDFRLNGITGKKIISNLKSLNDGSKSINLGLTYQF